MKRRSGKYLNAREYAERLYLSDNPDIQDFARDFLEAFDALDDHSMQERLDELENRISEFTENLDEGTALERLKWLNDEAETLAEIEKRIHENCPEYEDKDIEDIIPLLLKQLAIYKVSVKARQEFDL